MRRKLINDKKDWKAPATICYVCALITSLLFSITIRAQMINAGKIVSYKKITGGIEGKTTNAIFDIQACSENTVRVRITRNNAFNAVCYALKDNAVSVYNAVVTDKGNRIEISTPAITVQVEKQPVLRIIFKNKKGEVINEDEPGENFGTGFAGNRVNSYKKLQEGERFVGLGEVLGNLDKRGSAFTLNNTDTYKYGDPRLSMYISIPFYIGIHHEEVYGLFYNNTFKTFFNFGQSTPFTSVTAEGGDADYFLFYDTTVAGVLKQYTAITGRMPLPPVWSLGYQQSRCSYYPQEKVEWLAETFRRKKIPVDGIVLDADYQQDYQPFRTNLERFPDMPGLSAKLSKMNIELTASVYPGVRIDSTYESYTDGLKKNVFIKYLNGDPFKTEIAPLKVMLPDYTDPKTRNWWADKMKWMKANGIHGYWNDMNEPAVGGSYLPDNLLFNFEGRKATSPEAKNVYGFQMARSSYEAGLQNEPARRPFVLTRSAFAGVQRYAAVWSGDNTASNEGLLSGVLLNSQMSLSGIPFVGPDLGGYIGDGSKDLFKRWMEVGIFSPYVRNHKEFFASANEPWAYGEEAEAIAKTYIGFRYRLMPYIYSKFYEAAETGMPIARSLCINYPHDEKVYDNTFQYQFLFGDALLVTPVTTDEKSKTVYLPQGEWYDLSSDEKYSGGKEVTQPVPVYRIPVFVKGSSVIPMQSLVQSTKDKASDTLYIHLFNGSSKNSFTWYEDAGDGFDYKQGGYARRLIEFNPDKRTLLIDRQSGMYSSAFSKIKIIFHGFEDLPGVVTTSVSKIAGGTEDKSVEMSGRLYTVIKADMKILDPLENLSDIYDPGYYRALKETAGKRFYPSVTIDNTKNAISVIW